MKRVVHAWPVRVMHWLNVVCMLCMFMSGWAIYNASPLFGFRFPVELTVGGWLGGSLAWHFAFMWLLVINGLLYVFYGLISGHFKSDFLPVTARAVLRDMSAAVRFRLVHEHGVYNAVQRLMYWLVLAAGLLVVVSGLAIWKPIQLHALATLLGGYDAARYVHFAAMAGIGVFIVVHLLLVLLVPKTLLPMIIGRLRFIERGSPDHD
ncbi:cytochrome b/b6 domain-containing protein [Pseudomonas sp. X10]